MGRPLNRCRDTLESELSRSKGEIKKLRKKLDEMGKEWMQQLITVKAELTDRINKRDERKKRGGK